MRTGAPYLFSGELISLKHLWKHSPTQTYFKTTCCSPVPMSADNWEWQSTGPGEILMPMAFWQVSNFLFVITTIQSWNQQGLLTQSQGGKFPFILLGETMLLILLCSRLLDWERMPGDHARVQLAEQGNIIDIAVTRPNIIAGTEKQSWLWAAWRQWWSPAWPICQSIWSPNELLLITAI